MGVDSRQVISEPSPLVSAPNLGECEGERMKTKQTRDHQDSNLTRPAQPAEFVEAISKASHG